MKNNLSILDNKLATNGAIKGSEGATGAMVGGRGEGKTLVLKISTRLQKLSFSSTACSSPSLPLIAPLVASLLSSIDRLFFISHRVPGSGVTEWSLVRVAMRDSLREHPNCTQDGRFLVDFYTCHPKDKLFNAVNQRY